MNELPKEIYSLCEAVADLSASFITSQMLPADSREMNRLCIEWGQEFEEKNQDVSWGVDEGADYIEAIDTFFNEKYRAWLQTTIPADTRANDMIEPVTMKPDNDLLAVLKDLLEWESQMGGWEADVWERARAIVEKARPKSEVKP